VTPHGPGTPPPIERFRFWEIAVASLANVSSNMQAFQKKTKDYR
jgi:hypothetical protein